ncbi:MAG: hypothetical protein JO270_16240 [Acidobacteriaceae bacterium]|nr:hypothetical protein [Acidobacteriaceae bacterium]MBV8569293.1 hypothetical protein [Acidobacteriaceae bacterium]
MNKFILIGVALSISALAYPQGPGGPPGPPMRPGEFGMHSFGPGRMMGIHPGKVVTGAPFSASFTDTITQTLPGNSINRTTSGTIARDSQGRTYFTETIKHGPLAQNGPTTLTFVFDPVAGYSYVLNAKTKTAMRRAIKSRIGGQLGPDEESSPADTGDKAPPGTTVTRLTTPPANWNVSVTGKQITHTIPAGEIGNSAAIVSTTTIWYATDLQTVVYSTHTDPRFGTSTYALSGISTSEPAASLFQIPNGYSVEDAPTFHGRSHRDPNDTPPPPPE